MSALKHQKVNERGERSTGEIDLLEALIHIVTIVKRWQRIILFIFLSGFTSSLLYYFIPKARLSSDQEY